MLHFLGICVWARFVSLGSSLQRALTRIQNCNCRMSTQKNFKFTRIGELRAWEIDPKRENSFRVNFPGPQLPNTRIGGAEMTRILSDNNSRIITAPQTDPVEGARGGGQLCISDAFLTHSCYCRRLFRKHLLDDTDSGTV